MCNFIYLDVVFLLFCFVLIKNSSAQIISAYSHQLNHLILGRFKGNKFLSLPSTFFKLVAYLPIGLSTFFFCFVKFFHILQNFLFFSETSTEFQKGYQLKDRPLPCVPAYFLRVFFYLSPLSPAFKKGGDYLTHKLFFVFSITTSLKSFND